VANIDTSKNLYQNLGLEKGATPEQVVKAYEKKDEELKKATTTEAKAKREEIAYVKKVLTNPQSKSLYDQAGIEPTIFTHKIGDTLYLYISKISPTTFGEFAYAIDSASSTKKLNSMIIDFRGNVGGSLDFLQNFLGLFVGPNQYAFDLFHQGDYQVQRTVQPKFPLLDRYKEIAIITDNMTQSTADLTAATFKRLHLAKVVGTNTRGWGTVENTYPVETVIDPNVKYTLLLVNSVTLRDDNQSIEGMGVDPNVRTTEKTWKSQLINVFNSTSLIEALKQTAGVPPLK
jgi:C-terminal processing protease CtpA/Prc